jgi:tetratricopeptide (TPR) repeat protein
VPEAIAEFREVVRLKPDFAQAHINLGVALRDQGKLTEAIAELREAIRLKPDDAQAHSHLGNTRRDQGKFTEAIAAYSTAIRLKPDDAAAHIRLGAILCDVKHDYTGAEPELREAIRLKPDDAAAHMNLGVALRGQGKLPEAIAEFREAIRLKPDDAEAHFSLGYALRSQGDYPGSLAILRRGHELGIRQPGWRHPSAQWVAAAERLGALAPRFPALLRGEDRPKDVAERAAVAKLCYDTRRFAAAARFWAEAFAADSELAEDLAAGNRYNAACAAALAGAGRGEREPPLDEQGEARWRKQAVAWLRADLARRTEQARAGTPQALAEVGEKLVHWKSDPDLAGIRDATAIGALSADEQAACRALWSEGDALLARARGGRP